MYLKSLVLVCVLCFVLTEGRPKWQYLPEVPGYVPVYIRNGDTPLEEINPDLAEAFHVMPIGRSVAKQVEAAPDSPDHDQSIPEDIPEPSLVDPRPNETVPQAKKTDFIYSDERR